MTNNASGPRDTRNVLSGRCSARRFGEGEGWEPALRADRHTFRIGNAACTNHHSGERPQNASFTQIGQIGNSGNNRKNRIIPTEPPPAPYQRGSFRGALPGSRRNCDRNAWHPVTPSG